MVIAKGMAVTTARTGINGQGRIMAYHRLRHGHVDVNIFANAVPPSRLGGIHLGRAMRRGKTQSWDTNNFTMGVIFGRED